MSKGFGNSALSTVLVFACCLFPANLASGQSVVKGAAPAAKPAPTTAPAPTRPAKPRIAHIRITGKVMETPPGFSLFGETEKNKTLREWLNRLAKARQDDQVAAVALEVDEASLGWSQAQELADSVRRLREVKPVYAFLVTGGISHYILLSSASELAMEPAGDLEIVGLAAEMTFFRGTLDKLGIEPQMIQIGKYKGASEPMMLKEPSEELKGEYDKLLDDLYSQMVSQIAANRKLKPQQVKEAIDQGPFDGGTAKKLQLVDSLVERSKWEDSVGRKVAPETGKCVWMRNYGQDPKTQLDLSNPFSLLSSLLKKPEGPELTPPLVAIVHAQGTITSGQSGEGFLGGNVIGDRTLVKTLNEVAANDKIKAVVVRIDSPGGSALASEMIYQAIRNCAAKKPVIASISGMGASGGYYIALGAPTIYADSTALVGSIGVISGKIALDIPKTAQDGREGLFQKLGISTYAITRGKNAGLELSRPWTPQEMETVRTLAQRTYEQFTSRVSESRGKRIDKVADVAQGRIFTAQKAVTLGMIDKIGGMREAVEAARKAAGITGGSIISLPKTRTLVDLFTDDGDSSESYDFDGQTRTLLKVIHLSDGAVYMLNLCGQLQKNKVLLAMPYYVQIKG
jgi:protease-4